MKGLHGLPESLLIELNSFLNATQLRDCVTHNADRWRPRMVLEASTLIPQPHRPVRLQRDPTVPVLVLHWLSIYCGQTHFNSLTTLYHVTSAMESPKSLDLVEDVKLIVLENVRILPHDIFLQHHCTSCSSYKTNTNRSH